VVTAALYQHLHVHGIDMSARLGKSGIDVAGGVVSMVIRPTLYP